MTKQFEGMSSPGYFLGKYPYAIARLGRHAAIGDMKHRDAPSMGMMEPKFCNEEYAMAKLFRHLMDHMAGQVIDEETGHSQMCGIVNSALMVLEGQERAKHASLREIY